MVQFHEEYSGLAAIGAQPVLQLGLPQPEQAQTVAESTIGARSLPSFASQELSGTLALKGEFKPEYAGKMNFYCSVVDDQLRHSQDQPTLGLILC